MFIQEKIKGFLEETTRGIPERIPRENNAGILGEILGRTSEKNQGEISGGIFEKKNLVEFQGKFLKQTLKASLEESEKESQK